MGGSCSRIHAARRGTPQDVSNFAMKKIMTALGALLLVVPLASVAASDDKSPSAKSGSSKSSDDKGKDGKREEDRRKDDKRKDDKDKLCKPERGGKSKCNGGGADSR